MSRTYPHSLKTERALLGGVMADPGRLLAVADIIQPRDFYLADHRRLWALLLEMHCEGEPIDLVTVPTKVQGEEEHRFGGVAYVLELPDHCPATSNLTHYASEVRRLAAHRLSIEALEQALEVAYNAEGSAEELLDEVKAKVEVATRDVQDDLVSGEELADSVVVQAVAGKAGAKGFSSGLKAFNKAVGYLYPSDLVVVAARPGQGKTAMAAGIASHTQEKQGPVAVFSMEMTAQQWMGRIICQKAKVSYARWRSGRLSEEDVKDIKWARAEMGKVRLYIDDRSSLSIDQIKARCARLGARFGKLSLVVIDYLQLMGGRGRTAADRIEANSKGAKELAKDQGTTVLLLSQLNREVEKRQDKQPVIGDLRGSGAIEQDADKIVFLYRDEVYNKRSDRPGEAEIIGAKNRHGEGRDATCMFEGPPMLFRDKVYEGE